MPVAMFCTGGIRCEKAVSYLKQRGNAQVFQLSGGILEYLKTIPEKNSAWNGECFVFDNRVSVTYDLNEGKYFSCLACGNPYSDSETLSPLFEHGVSCISCHEHSTNKQKKRFRVRNHKL